MSIILDFYRGDATDTRGRHLQDIWTWDDEKLEFVHDYIQWLFPLTEPSQFNPFAPLLTQEDIAVFRADETLRAHLMRSFERILSFFGLEISADGGMVEGNNFSSRIPEVWEWENHNWLRISRILRSLTILGLEKQARAFYVQLSNYYQTQRFPIPANTFQFWTDAVNSEVQSM